MTPRRKRLWTLIAVLAGLGLTALFVSKAFEKNLNYFYPPSEVASGKAPSGTPIRVGGMVSKGSVVRAQGSLEVQFVITDFAKDVTVKYTGLLPDLFREGQGIIAHGELKDGIFMADEVLAKHDEKYMPPEIAKTLKRQPDGTPADGSAPAGAVTR
ncbi:MAG: cytochrome c maturation protein CcmE [Pseudomonadota bacterium]|jgi:cytochrome c-type biogenesis protein CcmE